MTSEERAALKAICADEPNLRETLAVLDAELQPAAIHVAALLKKRSYLVSKLSAIDEAKEKLAAGAVVPAESEPAQEAFAEPDLLETEPAKEEDHG